MSPSSQWKWTMAFTYQRKWTRHTSERADRGKPTSGWLNRKVGSGAKLDSYSKKRGNECAELRRNSKCKPSHSLCKVQHRLPCWDFWSNLSSLPHFPKRPHALTARLDQFGFHVSPLKPHSYTMVSLSAPTLRISLAIPQLWWNFAHSLPRPAPRPQFPACAPEQWDEAGKDRSAATLRKFESPPPSPRSCPWPAPS